MAQRCTAESQCSLKYGVIVVHERSGGNSHLTAAGQMISITCFALVVSVLQPGLLLGQSELTLEDIIKAVEENETLYQNIDVTMVSNYDIGDRTPAEEVAREYKNIRYISQNNWFKLRVEGDATTDAESY